MGKIILPDECGSFPATFADDSYPDNPRAGGVIVTAQLPGHSNIAWYFELVRRFRREVKYGDFKKHILGTESELERSVLRGIRDAVVFITDPFEYRFEIEESIRQITRKPVAELGADARTYFQGLVDHYTDEMILIHSPLLTVDRFLGGQIERADLAYYRRVLGKPQNIRIFASRSMGAFFEVVDPESRQRVLESLWHRRYIMAGVLGAHLLWTAGIPHRVFDEGNVKATGLIRKLRRRVHHRLKDVHHLVLPPGSGLVSEVSSKLVEKVAVSDIAAGYARDLYAHSDGIRRVQEFFRSAFLNGTMLKG